MTEKVTSNIVNNSGDKIKYKVPQSEISGFEEVKDFYNQGLINKETMKELQQDLEEKYIQGSYSQARKADYDEQVRKDDFQFAKTLFKLVEDYKMSDKQSFGEYLGEVIEDTAEAEKRSRAYGQGEDLHQRTIENLDRLNKMVENDSKDLREKAVRIAKNLAYVVYDLIGEHEEDINDELQENLESLIQKANKL